MELKLSATIIVVISNCLFLVCSSATENADDGTNVPPLGIIGGVETFYGEFPFMAALGWENNVINGTDFLGGGMVVAPNFVLTAAHCVFLKGKLPHQILVGGDHLNSPYNEKHRVKKFFIYPGYINTQAYYDIALLQLEKPSESEHFINKFMTHQSLAFMSFTTTFFHRSFGIS